MPRETMAFFPVEKMTSEVDGPYDPNDPYNKWYEEGKEIITLDLLIGEEDLLGRGLGSKMIRKFLLNKFAHVDRVLIDPAEENPRAIHVYEKAGFRKVEKFTQRHDEPKPCWMMHLDRSVTHVRAEHTSRSDAKSPE